jgi:hypothetical protein
LRGQIDQSRTSFRLGDGLTSLAALAPEGDTVYATYWRAPKPRYDRAGRGFASMPVTP